MKHLSYVLFGLVAGFFLGVSIGPEKSEVEATRQLRASAWCDSTRIPDPGEPLPDSTYREYFKQELLKQGW